jgi:hypothetical protein
MLTSICGLTVYTNVMSTKQDKRAAVSHRTRIWIGLFVALAAALFLMRVITANLGLEEKEIVLGATYSKHYAEQLDLDWQEAFTASLDDLGIRSWRIPAYWDDLEPEPGIYDFSSTDWLVDQVAKRRGRVILAVGRKLPRWPECHAPAWTENLPEEIVRQRLLDFVEATVTRYRNQSVVVAWQVENEPFFPFGECPDADAGFLRQEIDLVRSLDNRPVMITESGELSTWVRAANLADTLGISTYRVVWSRWVGYFYWPITPNIYRRRAQTVRTLVSETIISELQAEPWVQEPIETVPIEDQIKIMDPDRLRSNVTFARRVGFPEAYLWGVEWWYWLKQNDYPEMWAAAKRIFRDSPLVREL